MSLVMDIALWLIQKFLFLIHIPLLLTKHSCYTGGVVIAMMELFSEQQYENITKLMPLIQPVFVDRSW